VLTLGNAYAALTELEHFGAPGAVFTACYHEREAAVQEAGPPFSRCFLLPLPDEADEVATRELVDLAAGFLHRDLCSPLGRAADLGRAGLTAPPWESRGQYFQTFGLFQLSWPRHALLGAAARRLCQRLVQRWMSKDAKPLRETVQVWVEDEWAAQELGAESFLHRLQVEVVKALGRSPDGAFAAVLERFAPPPADARGRPAKAPPRALAPEEVAEALAELERLVGQPEDDHTADSPAELVRVLAEASDRLTGAWGQKLAELPVRLLEEPAFRLAGAEEAIRQVVATLEQALQRNEPLVQDLTAQATDAHARLVLLAAPPRPGLRRPACSPAELHELLRAYPKKRFQSLVLQRLSAAFVSLRGHLSDELREVNFCRVRLAELLRMLEEAPASASTGGPGAKPEGIGRRLFASGCKDLAEAVEQFLDGFGPDDLLELDGQVEEVLKRQFTALVHVCLRSANILKNVEAALLAAARDFAATKLPESSAAELFLEQQPDEETAADEVAGFYAEAAPELTAARDPRRGSAVAELCVVAAPPGPGGDRFRALVRRALPGAEPHEATSPDDVLIYRELSGLALSDLAQKGPQAHDAYLQMSAADHFTPHSRIDVEFKPR
jgi:hypothetical protein